MIVAPLSRRTWTKRLALAGALVGLASATAASAGSEPTRTDTLVAVSPEVTLRVIEAGPKTAQTLVLIPGWCFTAEIWHKQIAALSARFHLVAFDPRSQGRSTILDHSNSPEDRAADLAGLINKLQLRRPVLVGWSQGVQDVAAFVLAHGTGELGGLVLVDAPVSAGTAGLNLEEAAGTLGPLPIYVRSPRDYLEGMMPYIFKAPLTPGELETIVTAALRTPSSIGVANLTIDFYGRDYRPALARIEVPTLLVVAAGAPDKELQLKQPIPGAESAIVEGAGHGAFYDQPAIFNALLADFVERRVSGVSAR